MLDILIGISLYLICELFSYLWHRFVSHDDLIPILHDFHKSHHEKYEKHDDFLFVVFTIIMLGIIFIYLINLNIISVYYSIFTMIIIIILFIYNLLLHISYHDKNSMLNYFNWFELERQRHQMHHINPKINYGITCHLFDKLFGTWIESPFSNYLNSV